MRFNCSHCQQVLEVEGATTGQTIQCPACKQATVIPAPAGAAPAGEMPPAPTLSPSQLRDPDEGSAFGVLLVFSLLGWLLLLAFIVASAGALLLIIGFIWLARLMGEAFAAAYIRTNAVEVSPEQFPAIHEIVVRFSQRLGQKPPAVYLLQHSVWNALAMRLAGKRMVVLYSGAVDSLLLKGSLREVAWLVGHELGHHFAGHLGFWRRSTLILGSWFVWVALWYSRRCEFTCDRYGLACANSLTASQRAVCNMAVGAQLAKDMSIDAAVAQWRRHEKEFFVGYRTLYSTHPMTLARLAALERAAQELKVPA